MKNELSAVYHAKERQRFIEFRWELYVPLCERDKQ